MDCNIVKSTNKIRHCSFAVSILMVAVFYCPILSQGLVDFVIGLVNAVLNLPDGLLKVFFWWGWGGGGEFKCRKTVISPVHQKIFSGYLK